MRLAKRPIAPVPVDIMPLIDVVFLLLLFFMLTSSFVLYPGIRVTLPKAETSKTLSVSNLVITLVALGILISIARATPGGKAARA